MALGIAKLKLFRVSTKRSGCFFTCQLFGTFDTGLLPGAGGWRSSDAAVAPTPYYTIGSGKVNDFFAGGILRGLGPAHETG